MMKLLICALVCAAVCVCGGCAQNNTGGADTDSNAHTEQNAPNTYKQITQDEAKAVMDSGSDVIILDVREQDEYDTGHIKDAVLIPHGEIKEKAERQIPDKDRMILVYCRTGRRSKIAAQALADMGYTNVMEFGGINDWKYGTVN